MNIFNWLNHCFNEAVKMIRLKIKIQSTLFQGLTSENLKYHDKTIFVHSSLNFDRPF